MAIILGFTKTKYFGVCLKSMIFLGGGGGATCHAR